MNSSDLLVKLHTIACFTGKIKNNIYNNISFVFIQLLHKLLLCGKLDFCLKVEVS